MKMESTAGDPEVSWKTCGSCLMEDRWDEGFWCVLAPGHEGPHINRSWTQEDCVGTDARGRKYHWAYVWTFDEEGG